MELQESLGRLHIENIYHATIGRKGVSKGGETEQRRGLTPQRRRDYAKKGRSQQRKTRD